MKKVFFLVYNLGTNDSRVMKEAHVLLNQGYDVTLFGNSYTGLEKKSVHEGIKVQRFDCWSVQGSMLNRFDELRDFKKTSKILKKSVSNLVDEAEVRRRLKRYKESYLSQNKLSFAKVGVLFLRIIYIGRLMVFRAFNLIWRVANKLHSIQKPVLSLLGQFFLKFLMRSRLESFYYSRYATYALNILKEEIDEKPDVIHAHDLYTLPAAVLLAKRYGAKVIYDAHELEEERVPPLTSKKKNFVKNLEEDCIEHVDDIITVSPFLGDWYARKNKGKAPVLILNSPSAKRSNLKQTLRSDSGLELDVPLLVYTGGVGGKFRGLQYIVEALKGLDNVHLAVVGSRLERTDRWLMSRIDSGVKARLHLLPPVDPDKVVDYIATADVAVCPIQDASLSYRHCLPNKFFEAIVAELPIYASHLPEMSKIIEDYGLGLTAPPNDVTAIESALKELLNSKSKYAVSYEKNKEKLSNDLSWESQAKKLILLYENLI